MADGKQTNYEARRSGIGDNRVRGDDVVACLTFDSSPVTAKRKAGGRTSEQEETAISCCGVAQSDMFSTDT